MTEKHRDPEELQSQYWRQRAREAWEAIQGINNPDNKKILEEVARSYEEMADLMGVHERAVGSTQDRSPAKTSLPSDPKQICASNKR